jgi:hypothetical protein
MPHGGQELTDFQEGFNRYFKTRATPPPKLAAACLQPPSGAPSP